MLDNNKEFKNHLQEKLESINNEYKYKINWFVDIEKRKIAEQNPKEDVRDKEIFIVLTPLPSRSYGDNAIVQQIEITAMCNMNDMEACIDILNEYQDAVVQKKWWTDSGVLVNESWYSPSVQETLFNLKTGKGSIITMQGSVSFTPNVVDVEKIFIFNEWVKTFEFVESTTADTLPSAPSGTTRKKSNNRTIMYVINLKCKSTNNIFCNTLTQWKEGEVSINVVIPVKLIYNNGTEKEHNMIVSSAVFTTASGTIPTWSVQLTEKM